MLDLPLPPLKVAILDKDGLYAGVLRAIIETKVNVESVKTFDGIKMTDNALRHDEYNILFIDIFSVGTKQGPDFISYVRTQYPIVPICLYSYSDMLTEMKGVSDYWKDRFSHYFKLEKDQTIQKISESIDSMLFIMAHELNFNIADLRTSEIKKRIEEDPKASAKPDQRKEDIDQLQELLSVYRRTLYHYIKQKAMQSTSFMPPGVDHGILEARKNIRYIKGSLRGWSVIVEDYPYDEEDSD